MIKDESWPIARLIPISSASGIEAQERRAASALLAVISAVNEFGKALLRPLGAPTGKIEAFIEIPFKVDGRSVRPDGIITVTKGDKIWGAIIETKTAANPIELEQIETYLDLARELDFNAVLSISNQFVTSSAEYPLQLNRRKLKKVSVHHWSWVDVLTEAVVQKQYRGISDPDQAYILNELIRYLSDPRSGAVAFESMGPSWTRVRDGARDHTLRKNDPEVAEIAFRWDELVRYLCLDLTKELGRDVQHVLKPDEKTVASRQRTLRDSLSETGELSAEIKIPNASGSLHVVANLASRQISVSTRIDAPKEGRSKGRVSWIMRQLANAPDSLKVEARLAKSTATLASNLGALREDVSALYPEADREIRQFILTLTRDMGVKRDAGRGSFINSVLETTKDFYVGVLQGLIAWKAKAPKLAPRIQEKEVEEIAVDLPKPIAEAVLRAGDEMEELAESQEVVTDIESDEPKVVKADNSASEREVQ